ncbi:MAG: O-antigen ligase family protein [Prevotella sp.]|nr:O-antigen ligase family protein [Prevotella sp.]
MTRYLRMYLVYVVLYSFIASYSIYPRGEYLQNMILFFFEFIGMAYCLSYVYADKKSIRYFNIAIVISSVIIIVYGILNYILKVNVYLTYISMVANLDRDGANDFMQEQRGFLDGRISSTFQHPLQLGQAALILFTYILYEFRNKVNIIIYAALLIGLAAMCVLCGSRSAIFPLFVSVLFYLKFLKKRVMVKYIAVAAIALVVYYPTLSRDVQRTVKAMVFVWDEKASQKADIHGSSISGRMDQYASALKIVENNPLIGFGKGYVTKHGDKHPEMYGYESVVLKEIVDGGVLGLCAFIAFYLSLYRSFLRQAKTSMERARTHSLWISFLISIFLTGISYSFFSLFIVFACISYYSMSNTRQHKIIK